MLLFFFQAGTVTNPTIWLVLSPAFSRPRSQFSNHYGPPSRQITYIYVTLIDFKPQQKSYSGVKFSSAFRQLHVFASSFDWFLDCLSPL